MDGDEEDHVFYGTPIEREEDTSTRKRKAAADAGQLRSLPVWKQEVRDEEGRRRFHGAFTGGFSAGYYNTVGSKEGWTPQTFTSSRKSRAEFKQQSIYQFLDDDEIKDMGGHALETSTQFDTFGFTAAEYARKQAEKEQEKRPSAIPGPAPDDIVLPATDSIGMKLLQKMGWRRGHSIRETKADSLYDARREARKALIAFSSAAGEPDLAQIESSLSGNDELIERSNDGIYSSGSTPVYVLNPKQDVFGLGYDPFKHATEFRDRKELHEARRKDQDNRKGFPMRKNLFASNSGKYAPGFGIGALEELDVEDEDIYASGAACYALEETEVEEKEPAKVTQNNNKLEYRKQGVISGFKVASNPDYNVERFHPPVIPQNFEPVHKFSSPPEPASKFAEALPQEVPPPEDSNLKLLIDGLATLVARCGKLFEDLSKEKNKSNPLFSFITGGNGHSYYLRKLWEEKQKHGDQQKQMDTKSMPSVPKLTAESRGRILGERPLEKSAESSSSVVPKEIIHLQSNLSDTFTKPASLQQAQPSESEKPFKSDPAKQKRFELFLKDKYQGGLRSTHSSGTDGMSETDRARERLDFEAAAEAIEKGKRNKQTNNQSVEQFLELARSGDLHFIPSLGTEKDQSSHDEEKTKIYPKREEFQWRPSPILCKRFDIIDPFMGKPPPLPRARSRMETLIFTTDSAKSVQPAKTEAAERDALRISQPKILEETKLNAEEADNELNLANVERPVDLYKAIFSDDSDDEGDFASPNNVDDQEKKAEGANMTLNRLVAGDFLESLGKELGLGVPSDTNDGPYKANLETGGDGNNNISSKNERSGLEHQSSNMLWENKEPAVSKSSSLEIVMGNVSSGAQHDMIDKRAFPLEGDVLGNTDSRRSNRSISSSGRTIYSDHQEGEDPSEEKDHRSNRHKIRSQHRRRSRSSDSDSSSDSRQRVHSRSKSDKRSSGGESRKHSKHHKHKRRRSRSRYSNHDDDRDRKDDHRRKDKRHRDGASDATYSKHDDYRKYR
ncbi:G patch domain-containing protein 1 [Dioscorea alata]|uniref:G patch domain-containing protein 1 n=1 Tax=Dioscorea alata TaxID=55571 RepID=A0ACB7W518_DIOAL|nr:G patch domain-containing protein 1 [Dioscorea alata]